MDLKIPSQMLSILTHTTQTDTILHTHTHTHTHPKLGIWTPAISDSKDGVSSLLLSPLVI